MSVCKSCGAPLLWAKTAAGQRMPLDAVPSPDGGWVYAGPEKIRAAVEDDTVARYVPHWATCPDAASHRRKR
jgi:hypothetical protein